MASATRPHRERLKKRSADLLFELLDLPDPVLSGSVLTDLLLADAAPLIETGLLKPSGHTLTVTAGEGDDLPVALIWHDQRYGYFGAYGWVDVDQDRLARYVVDVDALCHMLLPDEKNAHFTELAAGLLWDLGTVRLPHRKRRVALTLVRHVFDRASWHVIRRRLVDLPHGNRVVIIATARRDVPDDVPLGNRVALLGDVIEGDRLLLNLEALSALLEGSTVQASSGPVVVVSDGREVRLYGEVFRFPKGDQQRRIIRAIHQRYLRGQPLTAWAELAAELELGDRSRLRDYFKNEKQPVIGRLLYEGGGLVGFFLRG